MGRDLDIALGVAYIEGDGPAATKANGGRPAVYYDAVGDLDKVGLDAKGRDWGASCSEFQIRTLHNYADYPPPDSLRIAEVIHDDPLAAAQVALALQLRFGWGLWSAYKSDDYLGFVGQDYELIAGHPRAAEWSR